MADVKFPNIQQNNINSSFIQEKNQLSQNQSIVSNQQQHRDYQDMNNMAMRNGVNENRSGSFQSNRGNSMGNWKTVGEAKKQRKE